MNIITVPYGSKGFYVRPDTSLNRDSNDYFCPDGITGLAAAVFVYAKASKAGKCVSAKFAQRYYTAVGTGVHFSAPCIAADNTPESWWLSQSLDNSSFIIEETDAESADEDIKEKINAAFEAASKFVSFRTGDIIAVEIGPTVTIKPGTSAFNCKGRELNIIW